MTIVAVRATNFIIFFSVCCYYIVNAVVDDKVIVIVIVINLLLFLLSLFIVLNMNFVMFDIIANVIVVYSVLSVE